MTKRIVIAGSRDYNNYTQAKEFIDSVLNPIQAENKIIIVSGGCRGADLLGERYARENGFEIEKHPADWNKYGLKAGPLRNEEMAKVADYVICFWDGKSKGTKNMIETAKKHKKLVKIKYIRN